MSSTPMRADTANGAAGPAAIATRYEVSVIPVTDVDRAKAFYEGLGWRLDADFPIDEHFRIVQLTPPGSAASVQFGTGLTTMAPGSLEGMYLIVEDIAAARDELIAHGAAVSEIWHGRGLGTEGHLPGPDPEHSSYGSFASFSDPDGNTWLLQEITERLPGRGGPTETAQLLRETAAHHGDFEAAAPPHDWADWYGAYMDARAEGSTEDEAIAAADRYMAEVKHVVASR
jgi:catechol 2,3-dioxygenase-like lactoylglutathione lyase family enzyme